MKHIRTFLIIITIIVGLILTACNKESTTAPDTDADKEALLQLIATTDSLMEFSSSDEATIDDEGVQDPEYSAFAKTLVDQIIPVRWGRHIFWDQIVRNYTVEKTGDSTAVVTITKTIPGEFWILDTTGIDSIYKKPFTEEVKRKVLFRRISNHADALRNWIPIAITMATGKTTSTSNKFSIKSITISGDYSKTISAPPDTAWFYYRHWLWRWRGSIPVFSVGDSIKVQVEISSSDDSSEIVVIRHGVIAGRQERRRGIMQLISTSGDSGNYTRVYERSFKTGSLPIGFIIGRFNATVDVMSYGSLYNDSEQYANEFWGMPYMVYRSIL